MAINWDLCRIDRELFIRLHGIVFACMPYYMKGRSNKYYELLKKKYGDEVSDNEVTVRTLIGRYLMYQKNGGKK